MAIEADRIEDIAAYFVGIRNGSFFLVSFILFMNKESNHPIRKSAEDLNKHFAKNYIQMAGRHMTRESSTSLIEKCNQNGHEVPAHTTIDKSTKNMCWRGCGEKDPSCTVGGNVNWCSHYGKQYGGISEN